MTEFDRLLAAIEAAHQPVIDEIYRNSDRTPPRFLWRPSRDDLPYEELKFLHDHWHQLRGERPLPHQNLVDPVDLKALLGFLTWLEPLLDGDDFRYRVYGAKIANLSGYDLTGKRISEMPSTPLSVAMVIAGHKAVMRRRAPLLSVHEPTLTSNTTHWTRLILPFAGGDGAVSRIMVANIPGDMRPPHEEQLPKLYPNFV